MGATNGNTDGANGLAQIRRPKTLAHVVLRTSNYEPMVEFWQRFLGAEIVLKNDTLCFLRFDEEHHRVAIIHIPSLVPKNPESVGLDHIAFTYETLDHLVDAYLQRKEYGIEPVWCVNHGPTVSLSFTLLFSSPEETHH